MTEGLVRLGLLEGEIDKLIEETAFKKFYAAASRASSTPPGTSQLRSP